MGSLVWIVGMVTEVSVNLYKAVIRRGEEVKDHIETS